MGVAVVVVDGVVRAAVARSEPEPPIRRTVLILLRQVRLGLRRAAATAASSAVAVVVAALAARPEPAGLEASVSSCTDHHLAIDSAESAKVSTKPHSGQMQKSAYCSAGLRQRGHGSVFMSSR